MPPSLQTAALLAAGFSIGSALLLAGVLLWDPGLAGTLHRISRLSGWLLLAAIGTIQGHHFGWLGGTGGAGPTPSYLAALFMVAPAGYLFTRPVLLPGPGYRPRDLLHLVPAAIAALLTLPFPLLHPAAFGIGILYLAGVARLLYRLRSRRPLFRLELAWLAAMLGTGAVVTLFGLTWGLLDSSNFVALHTLGIGLCMMLALLLALRVPHLLITVAESVEGLGEGHRILRNLDQGRLLRELERLMVEEELFRDPALSLSALAARLEITPHQLSALVNQRLQCGFSQYIRQRRVERAKRMLLEEPDASVLSIGLDVGFTSQSNLYQAFREVTGVAPGQFRRDHAA